VFKTKHKIVLSDILLHIAVCKIARLWTLVQTGWFKAEFKTQFMEL